MMAAEEQLLIWAALCCRKAVPSWRVPLRGLLRARSHGFGFQGASAGQHVAAGAAWV